ncbi:glycoside hydrolase family 20 zincin-like fold domain-containing protein [Cohnella zeiphila]|uniref:Family 20 glycosylhydrolase n=1 Tax=Cohnella zeiphila TaxID=2761120 RepID=A0A7X0SPC6_9BACL|nr:glycoside hydrolase family 20 zincin-like fold domain-containing protein [Cohnella zeiphila]MBB6732420.1 family 20 glycosylhydrolase [Cohnella zeiphila]
MLPTIPQAKLFESIGGAAAFRPGRNPRVTLIAEQDDPRLERHCRRAFPGMEYREETGETGFVLRIETAPDEGITAEKEPGREGTESREASVRAEEKAAAETLAGRKEGYRLRVLGNEAVIRAADAAGLFYGLQTLLQLLEQEAELPAFAITDWPDTALRCMNYDLRQTYSKPERLIAYLADFARFKVNALLIEYEDKFPFETYPELVHPKHALSKEQFEELKRAAREYFIEIIPLQQSFGHLEYVLRHGAYKHLRETEKSTGELCPSRPESYELATGLLGEMMDRHPDSRYIHLGCDEVYSLCECETCRERFEGVRERAFITFLNRLIEFTASRGRTPIFWHDMLDKCPEEELKRLDPRGVAMIWIYNGRNIERDVTVLTAKFRTLGIEVMGAPSVRSFDWAEHQNYPVIVNRVDNLRQWAETAGKLGIGCMVATNWTGPFSLGVPYGIFETTWYPMLLHADLAWNRGSDTEGYIDRFLQVFHGIPPEVGHGKLGNYRIEDYYDIVWKLSDEVRKNQEYAELIGAMHDFEKATDRSRAIHKYAYRQELYPGDEAERRSLLNNYQRNHRKRERARPRMQAALERFQPADMAAHFLKSRFYLHDYLERTLYRELGMNMDE